MKLHDLQGSNRMPTSAPLASAATAVTAETIIGRSSFKAAVVGAWFIPAANMTGAATNNRAISLVNRGAAGAGVTALATITYTGSVNGTALIAQAMTLGADVAVASGDVITAQALVNGSGLPLTAGGVVAVELQGA